METKTVACPFCGETMKRETLRGNIFWECPTCRAEVWPYDAKVEKEVRNLMTPPARKRKGGKGRKRSRFKTKKSKFVPWYQRP